VSLSGETAPIRSVEDLGRAVRARRRERHLTQRQLAAAAGVGRGVLQKLESGRGTVTADSLLRIVTALSLEMIVRERRIGLLVPETS
jgi:HTH-type transcriptional regulator/antitoxin HipB